MRHKKYWYACLAYDSKVIRDVGQWISAIIVVRLSEELCPIDERIDHLSRNRDRAMVVFLSFSLSLSFFKNANIVSRNEANSLKNDKRVRGRRSWPIILMKNIYMYLWTHWKMDSRWRIGKHAARSWLNDRS